MATESQEPAQIIDYEPRQPIHPWYPQFNVDRYLNCLAVALPLDKDVTYPEWVMDYSEAPTSVTHQADELIISTALGPNELREILPVELGVIHCAYGKEPLHGQIEIAEPEIFPETPRPVLDALRKMKLTGISQRGRRIREFPILDLDISKAEIAHFAPKLITELGEALCIDTSLIHMFQPESSTNHILRAVRKILSAKDLDHPNNQDDEVGDQHTGNLIRKDGLLDLPDDILDRVDFLRHAISKRLRNESSNGALFALGQSLPRSTKGLRVRINLQAAYKTKRTIRREDRLSFKEFQTIVNRTFPNLWDKADLVGGQEKSLDKAEEKLPRRNIIVGGVNLDIYATQSSGICCREHAPSPTAFDKVYSIDR